MRKPTTKASASMPAWPPPTKAAKTCSRTSPIMRERKVRAEIRPAERRRDRPAPGLTGAEPSIKLTFCRSIEEDQSGASRIGSEGHETGRQAARPQPPEPVQAQEPDQAAPRRHR